MMGFDEFVLEKREGGRIEIKREGGFYQGGFYHYHHNFYLPNGNGRKLAGEMVNLVEGDRIIIRIVKRGGV